MSPEAQNRLPSLRMCQRSFSARPSLLARFNSAIVRLDDRGIITTWNTGAERLTGFTERDAIGQPGDLAQRLFGAALVFRGRLVAGHLGERMKDTFDRPGLIMQGLKAAGEEPRYRQIVEGAEDYAIVRLDDRGIITTWNTGAERLTGFTERDAMLPSLRMCQRSFSARPSLLARFNSASARPRARSSGVNITTWNTGAERLTGFTERDAIGQPGDILFTPEDRALGRGSAVRSRNMLR
jgi:PAS domain-containing protein